MENNPNNSANHNQTTPAPTPEVRPKSKPEFVLWQVWLQIIVGHIMMAVAGYALINDHIALHPNSDQIYVPDYSSKLEFLTKYQAPNIALILFLVYYTISIRVRNLKVANPLSGNEHIVQKAKNILANTFEQYITYFVIQLMLLNYLDGQTMVKVVPFMCWCFFIGRVTFAIGYPFYRTFGMTLTLSPLFIASVYFLYKFLDFIEVTDCFDKFVEDYLNFK